MSAVDGRTGFASEQRAPARRGRPGYAREQVLAVAVQLFIEKGYDASSVADLADRLGLTKSALYHHFDSKEQLLELALDEALTGLESVLTQALRHDSAEAQLTDVIRGAVRVLVAKLPYVTLLLRVRGNGEVEAAAAKRRRRFDHQVTEIVKRAQAESVLREDVEPAVATRLIFGMVNSITEWYRPGGSVPPPQMESIVLAAALDGLRIAPVS